MTRLGVLIPCRDEALVVERKLENLARGAWPECDRPHRIVLVDDGSSDRTRELANELAASTFAARRDVELVVVPNSRRPGKAGAMQCALERLGDVDLCVLTDADVVLAFDALVELAAHFERDERVGMLSGSQRFVRDLAADGSCRAADGGELHSGGGLYDEWTAVVRRIESRFGRVFSVHGQLLAWRTRLELAPTDAIAADDIDLRCQARARGVRVELSPRARFFEVKAPAGEARRAQALRRARAYVQCVTSPHVELYFARLDRLDRLQFRFYRRVPLAAPVAAALATLALGAALAIGSPPWAFALFAVLVAAFLASPVGRRLVSLFAVIVRAARIERRTPLSDHWRTARR